MSEVVHQSNNLLSKFIFNHITLPVLATVCFGVRAEELKAQVIREIGSTVSNVNLQEVSSRNFDGLPPRPDISFPDIYQQEALPRIPEISFPESPERGEEQKEDSNIQAQTEEEKLEVNSPLITDELIKNEMLFDELKAIREKQEKQDSQVNLNTPWENLFSALPKPAVQIIAYSIAAILLMGAASGVVKRYIEFRNWWKKTNQIKKHNFTDSFQVEYLSIEQNGALKLSSITRGSFAVGEVLKTGGAKDIFLEAARKCTVENPFPVLHFPREKQRSFFRFTKTTDKLEFIKRHNQDLVPFIQGLYHSSSNGRSELRQIHPDNLKLHQKHELCVIEVCEVSKVQGETSRLLKILTISASDLDLIRNNESIVAESEGDERNLELVKKAVNLMGGKHRKQNVFPTAKVFLKPDKASFKLGRKSDSNDTPDMAI